MVEEGGYVLHDDLDVFVVDLDTLQSIHLLDLVDDVLGQLFHAFQPHDVVGARRTVTYNLAFLDVLAVENTDVNIAETSARLWPPSRR